ncbi:MAG: hypothetical protein LBC20_10655, partial [Planctomycetaceae bacterium]|nr:hypothetical protein [Planctomycetaceae bacterium]
MYSRPEAKMIVTIKDAAKKLKGEAKCSFEAQVTHNYCHGSARFAKTLLGWKPATIQKGLAEKESGLIIVAHRSTGRPSALQLYPSLETDIRAIVDPTSQANP